MTKRARTALFFTVAVLFFLTTPAAVLYSQGYRFDWEAKRVVQVGAFYFKAAPPRADISVDGAVSTKTDLFFGTLLTKGLIPKQYKVRIAKEGFHPWEKTLEVWTKQVTEAKNITLFPLDPKFEVLEGGGEQFTKLVEDRVQDQEERPIQFSEETESFAETFSSATQVVASPDGRNVAISSGTEVWLYALEDQTDQPAREKNQKIFLTRFSQKIENLFWLNAHYLIFSVGDTVKIAETDDRDRINIVDLATFPDPKLFWQPKTGILYILSDAKLYASEKLIP